MSIRLGARWARPLGMLALGALAAVGFLAGHGSGAPRPAMQAQTRAAGDQPTVSVIVAARGRPDQVLELPANLRAFEEAPIYARVSGYLRRWRVDIGDRVREGQVLAEIETPELDQQLSQARERLGQVRAKRDLARVTAERYQNLLREDAVSRQEVDASAADYQARLADSAAAEAEVRRLQELQGFRRILAPFSGTIGARNLDKATRGALIDGGSRDEHAWLYKLYQVNPLRVFVAVPQNALPFVQDGMPVDVLVREYPDRVFKGHVTRLSETLDPASRTRLTEAQVSNADGTLHPGMYATARFRMTVTTPPVVVPGSAVTLGAGGARIAVVDEAGVVHLRTVELGRDLGKQMELLSGCTPGERLVANPEDTLTEGTRVHAQLREEATAPAGQRPAGVRR